MALGMVVFLEDAWANGAVIRLACLLIGYGFGLFQTAHMMGKMMNIDARKHGSGNLGTTNAFRVLGKRAGFVVFLADVLKAVAAFLLCAVVFGGGSGFSPGAGEGFPLNVLPGLYAGLGVILGHNFPFFLRFKGGKGIACTLGVMLVLDWRAALPVYVVGAVLLFGIRYVSLMSLVMVALFPLSLLFWGHGPEAIVLSVLMAGMAFWLHRGNIARLCNGTERKAFSKKSKEK